MTKTTDLVKLMNSPILDSVVRDTIDPKIEPLELTGLQFFLDGVLGNRNGIAETSDVDQAITSGYFTDVNSQNITWQNLFDGITEHAFKPMFLEEHQIGYLSSFIAEADANKQSHPEQFNTLFLLIPDAIRAQKEGIKITPTWLASEDNPSAYTLHFSRLGSSSSTTPQHVTFILGGSSSNANLYTDRALELMQQTPKIDEVIVLGNPQDSLAASQPSLGWGFGLEKWDTEVVHARMAAVVEAQILSLEKNLKADETLFLNINDHSAGFWQTLVWYNRYKDQHPKIQITGFESFAGTMGLSRAGGIMNNQTLTALLDLFYPVSKNQIINFSSAKTKMITNLFAGGDEDMAHRFRTKGMGYGATSWAAAAATPKDFEEDIQTFLQTILTEQTPFRYNVSLNDHCISASTALENILIAAQKTDTNEFTFLQFHIYGLKNLNDKTTGMSQKEARLLRKVLKKYNVQIDNQGMVVDPRFKDVIQFHDTNVPGHFLVNQNNPSIL